jgi:hypothetical protein
VFGGLGDRVEVRKVRNIAHEHLCGVGCRDDGAVVSPLLPLRNSDGRRFHVGGSRHQYRGVVVSQLLQVLLCQLSRNVCIRVFGAPETLHPLPI